MTKLSFHNFKIKTLFNQFKPFSHTKNRHLFIRSYQKLAFIEYNLVFAQNKLNKS